MVVMWMVFGSRIGAVGREVDSLSGEAGHVSCALARPSEVSR
jgi:hypothetical protein